MKEIRVVVVIFIVAVLAEVGETGRHLRSNWKPKVEGSNYDYSYSYCLSWRLAAETNDIRGWRTVPSECLRHVQSYMLLGQYNLDLNLIIFEHIFPYINSIPLSNDGYDAWILDVDDTCLSNIMYYKLRQFGYVLTSIFSLVLQYCFVINFVHICIGVSHMIHKVLRCGHLEEVLQQSQPL